MTEELDLSLPRTSKTDVKIPRSLLFIGILVLIAVLANTFLILWPIDRDAAVDDSAALPADAQKQLALRLEKQGLSAAAISAWKEYLTIAVEDDRAVSRIWYRIGKLYQQENQYENALDGFYRSESFSPADDISSEISRRVQECLESLGRFSALRYELSDRVGMHASGSGSQPVSKGDETVAEIGPEKITRADLDRWIELQIERQLAQMARYLPEARQREEKEKLLKQFSSKARRQAILNQLVFEELLYRNARASQLQDDPNIKREIRQQEHALLANHMIERELAGKINITESDLRTYYEAHSTDYMNEASEDEAPRQKGFEEVKNAVFQSLRSEKEREIQEYLFRSLVETHDVVIHQSAFAQDEAGKEEQVTAGNPSGGSPRPGKD